MLKRFFQAFTAARTAPDVMAASKAIDAILEAGEVPSEVIQKAANTDSKLDVRTNTTNLAYLTAFNTLAGWYKRAYLENVELPKDRNDPGRDYYLSEIWKEEPIMAGAVYSMQAKMTALRWSVMGRRRNATKFARLLANAAHMDGYSWSGFLASTAQDFYTTNRGVFWETPRPSSVSVISGLGHIDALCCTLTGNKNKPMVYNSETTGQIIEFKTGEYIHYNSMPSPREHRLGAGLCAVDRALRALHLLMALHDYDDEKLSNLPPEGVATVTGMTADEFTSALSMWISKRKQDRSLTFPQVLWLIGSQPNIEVGVSMTPFSTLPESFNRNDVVTHYISTLALAFGVDTREFWPVSSGALGTASESEIQHLKAKGKGPGEFISDTERWINSETEEDTQFAFDTQDIEEDQAAAMIAKAWIDAYYPLYTGTPAGKSKASPGGKPNTEMVPNEEEIPQQGAANQAMGVAGPMGQPGGPEQVIDKDQLKRILADKGVLPEWIMSDERFRVDDTAIHVSKEGDAHPEDYTKIVWANGVLKEERLPPIILTSNGTSMDIDRAYEEGLVSATYADASEVWGWMERLKEAVLERNIRGQPIPDKEVERGANITVNTIRDELAKWAADPVLSKYVPSEDEMDAILAGLK